jgi:hypothetical protein
MEVTIKGTHFLMHALKTCAGSRSVVPRYAHSYRSYWMQVSCKLQALATLPPWNEPCTHSTGVWVGQELVWTFLRKKKTLLLLVAFEPATDCSTQGPTA